MSLPSFTGTLKDNAWDLEIFVPADFPFGAYYPVAEVVEAGDLVGAATLALTGTGNLFAPGVTLDRLAGGGRLHRPRPQRPLPPRVPVPVTQALRARWVLGGSAAIVLRWLPSRATRARRDALDLDALL